VRGDPVVAVCTNRSPGEAAEALAALAEQVPAERILVVTNGLAPDAVAAHRAAAPGPVVEEPEIGLSLARNRALDWAEGQGADTIAYVDDDAVVDPGWWEAVCRRWAEVEERIAVIGGPIRPRWSVEPPRWISTPILPTLTLLDLGDDERELYTARTTVYGANISFAIAPLRMVGGFDPRFGHRGRRIYFSEEDQAQRALSDRGFGVLYVPEMGVRHVIPAERMTRRSFVRRRFAYGRALGRRNGRSARRAWHTIGRSGPGSVVAFVRRDRKKFMERLVRTVENVGVLLGKARRG
jgi:glycosyltransferase involved in cell wall biosynthesis